MWQLCPKCKGEGKTFYPTLVCDKTCTICNGMGIISEITGLPPIAKTTNQTTNFVKLGVSESLVEYMPKTLAPVPDTIDWLIDTAIQLRDYARLKKEGNKINNINTTITIPNKSKKFLEDIAKIDLK